MHSLQKQFQKFIESNQLIGPSEKVLVAVSGGVDSMVLANLMKELRYPFGIAHCNFQLRGKESDLDEELVQEWATKHKVGCYTKRFEIGMENVQLTARNLRYQWFDELLEKEGYQLLATAHHLDDSLETVMLNLVRGTGIKGLTGIESKREKIIRPLQFVTKSDITAYAEQKNIPWREDRSNSTDDYDRNFVRNQVIPRLEELNPSLVNTFKQTRERLKLTEVLISKMTEQVANQYLKWEPGLGSLDLGWIRDKSDVIILSQLLSNYGFNYVTTKEIFEARSQPGKEFTSSYFRVSIDRNQLMIEELKKLSPIDFDIAKLGSYSFVKGTVRVEEVDFERFSKNPFVGYFHREHLRFPLLIRSWSEGDVFKPLGLGGTKKVSDLLIDRKVPVALKKEVLVLESKGRIAWVIGQQQADDFKLEKNAKKAIRITLEQ